MSNCSTFLQERIAKTKEQIVALEDAAAGIMSGAIVSYTLDTGQSRQTVTKANVNQINTALDSLYNRLASLQARCNGGGTVIGRAAW